MNGMRCPACGAPLADDAVICQNCGRVAGRRSAPKRPAPQGYRGAPRPAQGTAPRRNTNTAPNRQPQVSGRPAGYQGRPAPKQSAPRPAQGRQPVQDRQPGRKAAPGQRRTAVPRPVYDAPPPEIQAAEAEGRFERNKGIKGKIRLAARLLAAALMIAVIYIAGALIQTTRVRLSTYHFNSKMKMTYSSYGKAIDNYFEEGHWSANLFTNKCTYTGTTKHGEEYEMVFSTGAKIKLTAITIDGEPVEKDMIESKAMGMFI